MKRKLRIWNTPWHVAHNFDLCQALKPIADFDFLINYTRRWDEKNRDLPENVSWVTHYEKGKYDLVILHVDQQCNLPNLNKGILTKQMKEAVRSVDKDVPIIFINHATPVYPEVYEDGTRETKFISERLKKEILGIVAPDFMVVNSHQAAKDWGYEKTKAIIHGMDAKEWVYNENKEPWSATFVSAGGIGDKYYNRSFLRAVMEILKEKYGIAHQWIGVDGCFKPKNIKDYKEFLGKCLVYFSPMYASPMPRSRTEAMLSGCCIVTTPEHDADQFIKDGENGFLVPSNNPEYASELIAKLVTDYKIAKEIGKKGRETALQLFNRERYRADWINLLRELKIYE